LVQQPISYTHYLFVCCCRLVRSWLCFWLIY
jgi:hypothetical protein